MTLFKILAASLIFTSSVVAKDKKQEDGLSLATFAGGCFWCMESPFEELTGVHSVISGYAGGKQKNPTYKQVSAGTTGHTEVVQIKYDSKKVTYQKLLQVFWRNIDPTDAGGQFVDRGSQYRSEVFYHNDEQRKLAEASKTELGSSGVFKKKIVTGITKFAQFYPAEDYHQDYYKKNPIRYKYYRFRSGRDQFLAKHWPNQLKEKVKGKNKKKAASWRDYKKNKAGYRKPASVDLKKKLSKLQYYVTQKEGTEPSFRNKYWNNNKAGIYVDIVSGEPLFSSKDKYKSGTGWPSFTKPIDKKHIVTKTDWHIGLPRTEVRSKLADSHLGHVFKDGPKDKGGYRYCINSAALRFIASTELKKEGYEEYVKEFAD